MVGTSLIICMCRGEKGKYVGVYFYGYVFTTWWFTNRPKMIDLYLYKADASYKEVLFISGKEYLNLLHFGDIIFA